MQVDNEGHNLSAFFKMIDLIEDDISEMLEDENSELSGYECLIISFNCVTLFCRQVEIDFSQIEDHHSESKKNQLDENPLGSDSDQKFKEYSEIETFNLLLEEIENTLTAFENRCKNTGELFDAWNCVFIMYTCLRKYCDKMNVNYVELIGDVVKLQSNLEKEKKVKKKDTNTLN
jgi:hypothetical protein